MGRTVTEEWQDVIFLGTIRSDHARTISERSMLIKHQHRQCAHNREVRWQRLVTRLYRSALNIYKQDRSHERKHMDNARASITYRTFT